MIEKVKFDEQELKIHEPKEALENPYALKQAPVFINENASANKTKEMAEVKTITRNMPKELQTGVQGEGIQNIPSTLANAIQLFVEDTRRASGFKMVRVAAKQYQNAKTDEEAAEAMGTLAAAAIEYLRTRKNKSYADRKENCEAFLEEFKAFTVMAEPKYLESLQTRLRTASAAAQNKGMKFENNPYLNYHHELSDEWEQKIGARNIKDVIDIKKETQNTPMAARIRNLTEALDTLKKEPLPPYPEKEEELPKYRQQLVDAGLMFTLAYNKLISTAEQYAGINESLKHKPRRKEKKLYQLDLYRETAERAKEELRVFSNTISEYVNSHKRPDKNVTWDQVLAAKEMEQVQIETDTTVKMGAGSSVVYKLKRGPEQFQYFKEEEKIPESASGVWDDRFKNMKQRPDYQAKYEKNLDALNTFMQNIVFKHLKELEDNGDTKAIGDYESDIYQVFVLANEYYKERVQANNVNVYRDLMKKTNQTHNLKETMKYLTEQRVDSPLFDFFSDLEIKDEAEIEFLTSVMDELSKNYNTYYLAKTELHIKPGSSMSTRNVASSRIADVLGMGDMVARSETAHVKKGQQDIFGNLMEEAKGKSCYDKSLQNARYTDHCLKQFAMMDVFDWLCGQIDRNEGNYMVQTKTDEKGVEYIDSVKMIDNDFAFGNLDVTALHKGPLNMHTYNENTLYGVPLAFKKRILEMDINAAKVFLGDLLTQDEIQAFSKRLTFLQDEFKRLDKELTDRLNDTDASPESKVRAKLLLEDERYRTLYFQKMHHDNNSVGNTHMRYNNIDSEGTITFEMDDIEIAKQEEWHF